MAPTSHRTFSVVKNGAETQVTTFGRNRLGENFQHIWSGVQ